MKHFALCSLAVVGLVSSASAADITLTVESAAGESAVTVKPGEKVSYRVRALLSDNANEGLALIGFDLEFTGGDLTQADRPTSEPMTQFDRDAGLTNPAGYGGTEIGGRLVQVGGGQNTINNGQLACTDNADCPTGSSCTANLCDPVADFPVGMVITGVAEPAPEGLGEAIVVTGALTAPMAEGDYFLRAPIDSIFANVIKEGETGEIFYATEAAGVAASNEFMITVAGGVITPRPLLATDPLCRESLWQTKANTIRLTFDGDLAADPAPGEVVVAPLMDGGMLGAPVAGFTMTRDPGDSSVLIITEPDPGALTNQNWYGIRNVSWGSAEAFDVLYVKLIGDASNNNSVDFTDVNQVLASTGQGVPPAPARRDIDANNSVDFTDVNAVLSRTGTGALPEPLDHVCTVP